MNHLWIYLIILSLSFQNSNTDRCYCDVVRTEPISINDTNYWGQLGYLSAEQKLALEEFKSRADHGMIQRGKFTVEPIDSACLRFLRARKFSVSEALDLLIASDEKYHAENIQHYSQLTAEQCTRCDISALMKWYPHTELGYDKLGRPILLEATGRTDTTKLLQLTSLKKLIAYHCWYMERTIDDMLIARSASDKKDFNADRSKRDQEDCASSRFSTCVILDLAGLSLSHIAGSLLSHTQSLIALDSVRYPEVLGQMFVVNTPWWAVSTWDAVRRWLDPRTQAKIKILGSGPEITQALLEYIDVDVLPSSYGGNAPDPIPAIEAASDTEFASIPRMGTVSRSLLVDVGSAVTIDTYVTTGEFDIEVYIAPHETTPRAARGLCLVSKTLKRIEQSNEDNDSTAPQRFLFNVEIPPDSVAGLGDIEITCTVVWRNKDSYFGQPLAYNAFISRRY